MSRVLAMSKIHIVLRLEKCVSFAKIINNKFSPCISQVPQNTSLFNVVRQWQNSFHNNPLTLPIRNMFPQIGWDPCLRTMIGHEGYGMN